MSAYVVIQRFNDGTVNQGIPRIIFGTFASYDAATAYKADREAEDPKAAMTYTVLRLVKP